MHHLDPAGRIAAMTEDQKVKFLNALLATGLEATAARAAGCTVHMVKKERDMDPGFDNLASNYMEAFNDTLEAEAIRRGRDGVDEPVFYKGEEVSSITRYSDTLLAKLLTGRRPDTYGNKQEISTKGDGLIVTIRTFEDDVLPAATPLPATPLPATPATPLPQSATLPLTPADTPVAQPDALEDIL